MGVIDSATYAKLNCIHWHLVDEQSFPFDSPSFPLLSQMGSYSNYERYTVDDVAEVVEYARQRGIRVMVEIGGLVCFYRAAFSLVHRHTRPRAGLVLRLP